MHGAALDVGLHPPAGPVDELVGHDDVAGRDAGQQPADGAGREHLTHAERPEGPHVGAVVDAVRRVRVALPVPRQERHPLLADLADRHVRRRGAVRRLHRHVGRVVEELVEAAAADDRDGD
jgi:hypothetical protein